MGFVGRHPWVSLLLLVVYVVVPIDLVPEAFTGLFGYIDDIVLLVFYGVIKNRIKRRARSTGDVTETTAKIERQE